MFCLPSVAPPLGLCFLQWEDTVGSWGPHRYELKPLRAYMRSVAGAEHGGPIIPLRREPFKDRDGDVSCGGGTCLEWEATALLGLWTDAAAVFGTV